ncbi:hypothetical protein EST38_g5584 [Candolleomyces aberdarensis]|uniref:Copper transport protein n=1 Tax=Candolleomyces aberdarensis TaxID=2316362 RepID=A0A4Q2DK18_9AGAR|nr:hypothetical protein EST38_g5584 [Candolleomyces aberdarensis]
MWYSYRNTQIEGTCIIFRSWYISSKSVFIGSCIAIVLLCVFHEWLRVFQRKVDYRIALALQKAHSGPGSSGRRSPSPNRSGRSSPEGNLEDAGLLSGRRLLNTYLTGVPVPQTSRILRASIYGATVFISFFLMLVFMTYNAYLIAATVFGAALGHYIFGATMNPDTILSDGSQGKGMACH